MFNLPTDIGKSFLVSLDFLNEFHEFLLSFEQNDKIESRCAADPLLPIEEVQDGTFF